MIFFFIGGMKFYQDKILDVQDNITFNIYRCVFMDELKLIDICGI